jgi:uncharacterized protein
VAFTPGDQECVNRQAALPVGDRLALCGCTVAPGFDFADFSMPTRAELEAELPESSAIIERLTR